MTDAHFADAIIAKLSVHLGPNVSKMAVRAFAKKNGVASYEQLTVAHLPALIEEIRPMLNVMIGREPAEAVLGEIARQR